MKKPTMGLTPKKVANTVGGLTLLFQTACSVAPVHPVVTATYKDSSQPTVTMVKDRHSGDTLHLGGREVGDQVVSSFAYGNARGDLPNKMGNIHLDYSKDVNYRWLTEELDSKGHSYISAAPRSDTETISIRYNDPEIVNSLMRLRVKAEELVRGNGLLGHRLLDLSEKTNEPEENMHPHYKYIADLSDAFSSEVDRVEQACASCHEGQKFDDKTLLRTHLEMTRDDAVLNHMMDVKVAISCINGWQNVESWRRAGKVPLWKMKSLGGGLPGYGLLEYEERKEKCGVDIVDELVERSDSLN